MYSHLFFSVSVVALFSILENLKGGQKRSYFKWQILLLLTFICTGSFLSFLDEIGYRYSTLINLNRIFSTISLVNIFYIVANSKIPQIVKYIELVFVVIYLLLFLNGFEFVAIKNGITNVKISNWHRFNSFFTNVLLLILFFYNSIKIRQKTDAENLYQLKILKWSNFLLFFSLLMFSIAILGYLVYKYPNFIGLGIKADTRIMLLLFYFNMLLFVMFRPKLVDETDFSYKPNKYNRIDELISLQNFEFLFYSNQYYLKPEANLDDFALKLNHSKSEVVKLINTQTNENFTALVNRNRIKYFKSLLDDKKHESFTIEALSEMAGFNNRRTMYNSFHKYVGTTPTDYINSLN